MRTPMFHMMVASLTVAGLTGCGGSETQTPQTEASGGETQQVVAKDPPKSKSITPTADKDDKLQAAALQTIADLKLTDPAMEEFFTGATGYVVFPKIGKGGFIVGGAHGDGVLFENHKAIGTTSMTQGSIGFQIGGQTFSEIIFFETNTTLENFKNGNVEFSGTASAVAAGAGATADAQYENGVAIFIHGEKGLMAQASIGGQKFDYKPFE